LQPNPFDVDSSSYDGRRRAQVTLIAFVIRRDVSTTDPREEPTEVEQLLKTLCRVPARGKQVPPLAD